MLIVLWLGGQASFGGTPAGQVVGWGVNVSGEVTGSASYPASNGVVFVTDNPFATGVVRIAGQELNNVVSVAAGMSHSVALLSDGSVIGWGGNIIQEAVGYTTPFPHRAAGPVKIGGQVLTDVTAISAGWQFNLALKRDGTVVGWGDNKNGQINVPVGLSNLTAIAAGESHGLALKKDGTITSFGSRENSPAGLSNVVAIAASRSSFGRDLALKNDGTVVEWRSNGEMTTPMAATNIVAVSAGYNHNLALKKDGTVFGWGFNREGQATGVATTNETHSASGIVAIDGQVLSNIVAVAAGNGYGLALKTNGTVVAWGCMNNGLHPVSVPEGLSNVVAIAAGDNFCLAITTNRAVAEHFRQ